MTARPQAGARCLRLVLGVPRNIERPPAGGCSFGELRACLRLRLAPLCRWRRKHHPVDQAPRQVQQFSVYTTLETTQGQMNSFFNQLLYKCCQSQEAFVED